jgi:hypothetical protein
MKSVLPIWLFPPSRHAGGRRPARSRTPIQVEILEEKTLTTVLTPAAGHQAAVERVNSLERNPLRQLSFLVGCWNAQVKFPNGATGNERELVNYHFNRDHNKIFTKQVVLGRPLVYVSGVIVVDPANGQIVETASDSQGRTIVEVWAPTIPGSFVITDTYQNPNEGLQVSTTLSRFGRNAYIYARNVVYPDGSTQVEAIGSQIRVS